MKPTGCNRFFVFIHRVEEITLVWTILILALIGFVQVISRYVFSYSFTWFEELGRYIGVFVAFSGASIGVRTGSHFTMDLLVTHMKPPWQGRVRTFTNSLAAGFFFIVAYHSWKIVLRMHGYETTSPTLQIPMYIAYLPIPVFCVFIGIRFLITAFAKDMKRQTP
ncbi:TRAP transporter small permease [Desulfotignum balticum]|uniref:TRAP transporter small permease n=1 Tax=Desulfotignum balticum TaxID=115781 RepID=UPI0004176BF8|nr:TRAP transporter small permease [Desulfotignum balticum]